MALLKRKRIGLNDAMDVVTKFVNACNRHDADGVSACLHPDFDSIQPMYPTRNFRGAEQVRRNWQAIFDAEPGFRLTVLRSAATDDTVWLELHGAGRDAEVAGIFVMGIVGDRIRWARIYSALVEPVPAGVGEPPPPLHEVSRTDGTMAGGDGEMLEQDLIAPVLDMERSTRRRRRRRAEEAASATMAEEGTPETETDVADESPEDAEPVAPAVEAEPAAEVDGADAPGVDDVAEEAVTVVEVVPPAVGSDGDVEPVAIADSELEAVALVEAGVEPVAVIQGDANTAAVGTDAGTVTVVETDEETAVVVDTEAKAQPAYDGLDTGAVPIVWNDEPDPEPKPEVADEGPSGYEAPAPSPVTEAPPEPPKRRFGKRRD